MYNGILFWSIHKIVMKKITFIILLFILISPLIATSQAKRYYYNFDCRVVKTSEALVNGEMGLAEEKNNRGKHIQKYALAVFGYKAQGYAYCLAGQYWAIQTACDKYGVINYLYRTAHCNTLFNQSAKTGKRDKDVNYKANDLIIWKNRNNSSGHVERIKSVKDRKKGIVITYAFNTSSSNIRDGGSNAIKTRYLKHPLGRMFLRGYIGINGE